MWTLMEVLPAVTRLPSGIRLYSRAAVERLAHERQERGDRLPAT